MELVIPAAKSPTESKYLAASQKIGASPKARSAALLISEVSTPAAVMITLIEINHPKPRAMIMSFIAWGKSSFRDHFSRTLSLIHISEPTRPY